MKRLFVLFIACLASSVMALPYICTWQDKTSTTACPSGCGANDVCKVYTWERGACALWTTGDCYETAAGHVIVTVKEYACTMSGHGCTCEGGTLQRTWTYVGIEQTCISAVDPVDPPS